MEKETETNQTKIQKPRGLLFRAGVILITAIGPHFLVFLLFLLTNVPTYGHVAEKLALACGNLMKVIPLLSLAMFALAGLSYATSFFVNQVKRVLARDVTIGFLFGGVLGLVIGVSVTFMLQIFSSPVPGSVTIYC